MAVRVGLVGTGYWARVTQAAVLSDHPGVELVGVWGRDSARSAALAADVGARAYDRPERLFADVEVVAFAVPPQVQVTLAEAAAAAGRHLLLDKPVALDPAASGRLVAAVERAGVATRVFFTRRYLPGVSAFLERARAGGPWTAATAHMLVSIFGSDSPYRDSAWRREHGGLWDLGPHALSLVLPVLGPVELAGTVDDARGTSYVTLRHRGGAVSRLALGLDVPAGTLRDDLVLDGPAGPLAAPAPDFDPVAALHTLLDDLLMAVAGSRPAGDLPPCDAAFGHEVVAVLAAAETSRRAGRLVAM
jgi:predicted dehydrogenase